MSATQPITNDTTRPSEIYGGDLFISVKILVTLAEYNNASQGNISSEEEVLNLATAVSNLLDPGNAITWQNLEQVRALSWWTSDLCCTWEKLEPCTFFQWFSRRADKTQGYRKLWVVEVLAFEHWNSSYWAVFVQRCPLAGTSLEQLACEVVSNSRDPCASLCICCVVQLMWGWNFLRLGWMISFKLAVMHPSFFLLLLLFFNRKGRVEAEQ